MAYVTHMPKINSSPVKILQSSRKVLAKFPHLVLRFFLIDKCRSNTVCLTSIDHPQIGGEFTATPGELTNLFYGCKD